MRILIIEDTKAIAENEKRFLEAHGWEVDVAYDGKE